MYKIGSLFSGIGGFELGLERAIPNSKTIWQVEQNKFCQSILKKHWPKAKIYDDVRNITKDNVEAVDILCGGFPCQDISVAGKQGGLNGERSGLWWEMWRIIGELRPRIIVMENVSNILRLGGLDILGSLTKIGYDTEWTVISAKQFGAPHLRNRWFCVAYPNSGSDGKPRENKQSHTIGETGKTSLHKENSGWKKSRGQKNIWNQRGDNTQNNASYPNSERVKEQFHTKSIEKRQQSPQSDIQNTPKTYWEKNTPQSPICSVDDGIPQRVARLKALGNAIVPQCSQWIGEQIWKSGLLENDYV